MNVTQEPILGFTGACQKKTLNGKKKKSKAHHVEKQLVSKVSRSPDTGTRRMTVTSQFAKKDWNGRVETRLHGNNINEAGLKTEFTGEPFRINYEGNLIGQVNNL